MLDVDHAARGEPGEQPAMLQLLLSGKEAKGEMAQAVWPGLWVQWAKDPESR
jgi:hypothetical protein